MNRHPYLRAYMAGIALPTAVFLIPFFLSQFVFPAPQEMQRALIFPLALIPNAFGLWNMLYVRLERHWHHHTGPHGAVLPFFIAPFGYLIATSHGFLKFTHEGLLYFDLIHVPYWNLIFAPFLAIAFYYLIWKYAVGYLNSVLELPR